MNIAYFYRMVLKCLPKRGKLHKNIKEFYFSRLKCGIKHSEEWCVGKL